MKTMHLGVSPVTGDYGEYYREWTTQEWEVMTSRPTKSENEVGNVVIRQLPETISLMSTVRAKANGRGSYTGVSSPQNKVSNLGLIGPNLQWGAFTQVGAASLVAGVLAAISKALPILRSIGSSIAKRVSAITSVRYAMDKLPWIGWLWTGIDVALTGFEWFGVTRQSKVAVYIGRRLFGVMMEEDLLEWKTTMRRKNADLIRAYKMGG
jgi:hypothetical protein